MGARIGEIEEMCAPLQEAAKQADDVGSRLFMQSWVRMGDKLSELAAEDEARGRLLSAGEKLGRASTYYLTAERLQAHGAEGRAALYRKVLDTFARSLALSRANAERVAIPYGDAHLVGLVRSGRRRRRAGAGARADQRSR